MIKLNATSLKRQIGALDDLRAKVVELEGQATQLRELISHTEAALGLPASLHDAPPATAFGKRPPLPVAGSAEPGTSDGRGDTKSRKPRKSVQRLEEALRTLLENEPMGGARAISEILIAKGIKTSKTAVHSRLKSSTWFGFSDGKWRVLPDVPF